MKLLLVITFMFVSGLTHISHQIPQGYLFDEDNRKRITMAILNNFIKEDYEAVRKDFHASLKEVLPVEKLSEVWKQLVTTNGEFKKVISTTTAVTQGFNQVKIRCQFANDNATLETTFNEDDKVFGLFFKP